MMTMNQTYASIYGESKANTKTDYHYLPCISPPTNDSDCLTKTPSTFTFPSVEKPANLLSASDDTISQLPCLTKHLFENMNIGLFEPTPIGQEHRRPPLSIDIDLLHDMLNTATESEQAIREPQAINGSTATMKRKSSLTSFSSLSKKQRTGDEEPNFRPYQETKWSGQYKELLKFKEEHGHCNVLPSYKPELGLSRWIKRQRYQYKLRSQGKISTMTEERIQKLEKIGFVWDSHAATWDQRFEELKEFRAAYGHCDVPSSFASNPQLATWVKCQRRQYRLFFRDNALSSITPQRILLLEEVGFKWRVRDSEESSPMVSPI